LSTYLQFILVLRVALNVTSQLSDKRALTRSCPVIVIRRRTFVVPHSSFRHCYCHKLY